MHAPANMSVYVQFNAKNAESSGSPVSEEEDEEEDDEDEKVSLVLCRSCRVPKRNMLKTDKLRHIVFCQLSICNSNSHAHVSYLQELAEIRAQYAAQSKRVSGISNFVTPKCML